MTDELIEQLRARNPKPAPVAPPIDVVLTRIAAAESSARSRWPRWLGPALVAAVAVTVAAVVLVATRGGHHAAAPTSSPNRHTATAGRRGGSGLQIRTVPAMRGALQTPVFGFSANGVGVIGWRQLRTPRTRNSAPWVATTGDKGRSWDVTRRRFSLFSAPVFDGRDGWAIVLGPDRTLRFYATHDGGHRWLPASSPAAANSVPGDVSVVGGVVWAVGTGSCSHNGCKWTVMRGPASGDTLPATAAQPLPPTHQNQTTISAVSATTAYVTAPARLGSNIYITHDGGRSWETVGAGCGDGHTVFGVTATSENTLWQLCGRGRSYQVTRRTGEAAVTSTWRLPFIPAPGFEPVSAAAVWSQSQRGLIYRSTDAGHHWQIVWTPGGPHGGSTPGQNQELVAQSANDAALLVSINEGSVSRSRVPRSTALILYRTTDGGRSWQPSPVRLPHG